MAKVLSCKDLDPSVECDFTARGKTMEDVMRKAAEHGRSVHGMKEIPEEMKKKIQKAIHDE